MYISWLAQTLQHSKLLNSHDIHIQPNLRRLDDNIHCVSKKPDRYDFFTSSQHLLRYSTLIDVIKVFFEWT